MKKNKTIERIAVLRTDRIGEVLLSTAAIDAIKRSYPVSYVAFVTSAYSKPIVDARDNVDDVIVFDTIRKRGTFSGAVRLAAALKRKKFDTAVILNPHKSLHLACFLAGIPRRVGYCRKWPFLLTDSIPDKRNEGVKHEVEYMMDLLKVVGVDWPPLSPRMEVRAADEAYADGILTGKGVKKDKAMVIVHPGSSNKAKIWPMERYAEVVRNIRSSTGAAVLLIGGKEERALAEKIIKLSGADAVNMAGDLSLRQLAALIKRASLFIGNDAGPMHIAAALGVKVIAIFGRNIPGVSPIRWRPWGEGHVIFHETPGCDPCGDTACRFDYRCLKNVTAKAVSEAAKAALSGRK